MTNRCALQIVWSKLTAALLEGDMKRANLEKAAVEQHQRQLRKDREHRGQEWQPLFFRSRARKHPLLFHRAIARGGIESSASERHIANYLCAVTVYTVLNFCDHDGL